MQAKLIGVMKVDFTNINGDSIKGTNIFVAFNDDNVQGMRTEKFFLREELSLPKDTKINDTLKLSFNHKGKIESITKD